MKILKKIAKKILHWILSKIKMRYDLYQEINGKLHHMTYIIDNRNLSIGNILKEVPYNGWKKNYVITNIHNYADRDNPFLIVKEDSTVAPIKFEKEDTIGGYSYIKRLLHRLRDNYRK